MPRRFGRSRLLIAIGALVTLLGCFLPWYTVGGEALPAESSNAFDGAGIVVFVVAVALLAMLAVPYAARDQQQQLRLEGLGPFVLLVTVGMLGLALRIFQLSGESALGLPDRALGLWLAGIGLVICAWGTAELYAEPQFR